MWDTLGKDTPTRTAHRRRTPGRRIAHVPWPAAPRVPPAAALRLPSPKDPLPALRSLGPLQGRGRNGCIPSRARGAVGGHRTAGRESPNKERHAARHTRSAEPCSFRTGLPIGKRGVEQGVRAPAKLRLCAARNTTLGMRAMDACCAMPQRVNVMMRSDESKHTRDKSSRCAHRLTYSLQTRHR
jgi:hypothetical protein